VFNVLIGFFGGLLVGLAAGNLNHKIVVEETAGYYDCVKDLPRSQDCKLIAVPENGVVDWQDMPE